MERTKHEKRLLCILCAALNEKQLNQEELSMFQNMSVEEWKIFSDLAHQHRVVPLVYEGLRLNGSISLPLPFLRYLQQAAFQNSMAFYQKLSISAALQDCMNRQGVFGAVLKGPALSVLYPVPESRTFNDIDLYIPDRNGYEKLCQCFESEGYEKVEDDMTDYHTSFLFRHEGVVCDTEIHYRLNGHFYNGRFDDILDGIYDQAVHAGKYERFRLMNQEFTALPVDAVALHLLMHMFQHFMNKGFGLRLLCDWVVFWNKKAAEVNRPRFLSWVRELKLDIFLDAITSMCVTYLGLDEHLYGYVSEGFSDEALREDFLQDIFEGGAFGRLDENRIIVTSRKTSLKGYFLEMHRQMKKHFPKQKDIWILWPFLWTVTTVRFIYNNVTKRKISTIEVFESSGKRNKLAQKMQVFDEK